MHIEPRRRRSRRLFLFSIACLLGAIVLAPLQGIGAPTAGADDLPYTLEVTPTTGLLDGQAIDIVARADPGVRIGFQGAIRICRDDTTYTSGVDVLPQTGKCPAKPISSSGSALPASILSYPDGSTSVSTLRVGTGTVEWGTFSDPTQFSLTCDATHPCRLVLDLQIEGRGRFIDASTVLTFSDEDPIGTCGGSETGAISTTGPDRLLASWIALTREQCTATGDPATTQAIFSGEGEGHRSFHDHLSDLTYSGVDSSFPGHAPDEVRASVSVPIGLNAAVIGVLGGYGDDGQDWPNGIPRPYEQLKVTVAEMATLFGRGQFSFNSAYLAPMRARNPELAEASSLNNGERPNPLAPAGSDMVSFVTTTAFDTLAGSQWLTPPQALTGEPEVPRGIHDSLALATPAFSVALIELYSAQAQLKRVAAENEFRQYNYGPIWILTDLATAQLLEIPTVAVENSNGEFVAPTAASLAAAAPALQRRADGSFARSGRADPSGAYPLTFVEQAVAPTEPLLDETCKPRADSQALLEEWLAYITGPGQAALPAGLVPLTPALADEAEAARADVGAATPTGDCAPDGPPVDPGDPPLPPDLTTPRSGPGAIPSGLVPGGLDGTDPFGSGPGGSSGTGSTGSGAAGDDDGSGGPNDEEGDDEVAGGVAQIDVPEPTSGSSTGALAGSGALLGLAVLGGVGGMISSGRPIRLPGRRQP